MQLFNVTKTLQLGLFKLVAQLTIIIFAMWHDSYYSYLALVIGKNKKILNSYSRMLVNLEGSGINVKV